MLRGGTLFYALAIAVVLALMSGGLLLTAHLERLRLLHDLRSDAVIRNAQSGIELLLGNQQRVAYDQPTELDLFGERHDSVRLTLRRWGAFDLALAEAHNGKLTHRMAALTGWASRTGDNTALRMADLERPLGISGTALLRGDCYLPAGGIKRTYVEGQSYTRDRLVYGAEKKADRFLPEPDKGLLRRLDSLLAGQFQVGDSLVQPAEMSNADSLNHSFFAATTLVNSAAPLVLRNQHISGNWCFYSARSIRIEASADLHDVILVAPYIEIADGVHGNFQAFARDSFRVGSKVDLAYPTVLGLLTTRKSPPQSVLKIGEKSKIAGVVFGVQTVPDFTRTLLITLAAETEVLGQVWCNDLLELRGRVQGDVSCKLFRLQTNSAIYENQLLTAQIDRTKRPEVFVLSALLHSETDEKRVIRWLH